MVSSYFRIYTCYLIPYYELAVLTMFELYPTMFVLLIPHIFYSNRDLSCYADFSSLSSHTFLSINVDIIYITSTLL